MTNRRLLAGLVMVVLAGAVVGAAIGLVTLSDILDDAEQELGG